MLSIDMQFTLDEEKLPFLTRRPSQAPDSMADMVIAKCMRNKLLSTSFPILILFGAHILSFHE